MSYVYFIHSRVIEGEAIKIGRSTSPHGRCRNLQCGSANPLFLLAYVKGDTRLERRLHATFEPVRLQGEWFHKIGKLEHVIGYIEGYADENGKGGLITREQLEVALSDNLFDDQPHPDINPAAHRSTANEQVWRELIE